MDPICAQLRERIVESTMQRVVPHDGAASFRGIPDDEVDAHLLTCDACSDLAARVHTQIGALTTLSRLAPPTELDGLAVASWNAGHRQERATRAVRGLGRFPAPAALDEALWTSGAGAEQAPPVLDRLVAEELADPAKSLTRRFAARLERLNAPDLLRRRLDVGLLEAREHRSRRNRLINALLIGGLVGIATVATLFVAGRDAAREAGPVFVIERASSLNDFDGVARGFVGGLVGGAPDAARLKAERKL
jgi:hypothetical protein